MAKVVEDVLDEAVRRRHVDVGHRLRGVAPAIGDGFDCLYGEGHGVEGESRKLEELRGRSAAGLALVGDDRWLSCYRAAVQQS